MGCAELLELNASPWTTKVNHTCLGQVLRALVARSRPQSSAGAFGVEAPWRPVPNNTIPARARRVVDSISSAQVLGQDQRSHIILADGWCVRTLTVCCSVISVERVVETPYWLPACMQSCCIQLRMCDLVLARQPCPNAVFAVLVQCQHFFSCEA